jgi:hypothetical protein
MAAKTVYDFKKKKKKKKPSLKLPMHAQCLQISLVGLRHLRLFLYPFSPFLYCFQLSLLLWLFIHFTIQSLLEYHQGFTFFTSIGLLSFSPPPPQFATFVWITSTPQLNHLKLASHYLDTIRMPG